MTGAPICSAFPAWKSRVVTRVVHVPYVVEQGEDGVWCASAQLRPGVGAVGDGWLGAGCPATAALVTSPCSAAEPAHSRSARVREVIRGSFGLTADAGGTPGPGSGHYLLCPGTHQGIVRGSREHGSGNEGCGGNGISENDGSCVG